MFYIYCPHCEEHRSQEEFHPVGEGHIKRPLDPDNCTDQQWGDYLYFRKNTKGIHQELWVHAIGCRKVFNIARNTVDYTIRQTYKIGEQYKTSQESR